jgi:hypothetical protein
MPGPYFGRNAPTYPFFTKSVGFCVNKFPFGNLKYVGGDINTAKEFTMKNHIKLFGIITVLAVVMSSLISCDDMAELKIKNDTSNKYTIRVKIDGKTNHDGQLSSGGVRSYSQTSGFSYVVYATTGATVIELITPYKKGDVSAGDSKEVLLSSWE